MIDLSLHQYPYRSDSSQEQPGESSAPRSLSPPLPTQEPANTSFAFLVHSQDTIPNNLPPSVDNKPLARARRRRTSPEDALILEAEFLRDSKPDRAARAKIVERVALGEKEVQIWFQNRRQNSRRKSRPLLPHEILPHLQTSRTSATASQSPPLSRSDTEPSDISLRSSTEDRGSMSIGSDKEADMLDSQTLVKMETSSPIIKSTETLLQTTPLSASKVTSLAGQEEGSVEVAPSVEVPVQDSLQSALQTSVEAPTQSVQGSAELSVEVQGTLIDGEVPQIQTVSHENIIITEPAQVLKPKSSRVRLSMTSDGIAKILTGDESSPSPPRKSRSPEVSLSVPRGLRRSYSAAGLEELSGGLEANRQAPGLRRVLSGRSRDSRAWEFWCDSEARSVLTKKAEQEQSGSAADAISLMRSTSRSALTPISNKGNIRYLDRSTSKVGKGEYPVKSRAPFGRAHSSVGRLQGGHRAAAERLKGGVFNKSGTVDSSTADSDKENWDPIPGFVSSKHPVQDKAHARKPRLGESRTAPSSQSGTTSSRQQGRKHARIDKDKENANPEDDEEIASFMRTRRREGGQGATAGEDDLDCIQGLLSLSQGNWK